MDLSGWILIYHSPNYLFHLTVFLFFSPSNESLWRRQLSNNASTLWLFNLNFLLQCCVSCHFSVKNLFAPATLGWRVKKWNFQFLSRCWLFICCAIWLLGHKKRAATRRESIELTRICEKSLTIAIILDRREEANLGKFQCLSCPRLAFPSSFFRAPRGDIYFSHFLRFFFVPRCHFTFENVECHFFPARRFPPRSC